MQKLLELGIACLNIVETDFLSGSCLSSFAFLAGTANNLSLTDSDESKN